jgi:hypothetical protein
MKSLSVWLIALSLGPSLALGLAWAGGAPDSRESARRFTEEWAKLLEKSVALGLVDYGELAQGLPSLEEIEALLARTDPEELPEEERLAFWINAYNFLVVSTVTREYPVESPRDVPGFFDTRQHTVGAGRLTLDEIERQLRKHYDDPRIHFALVCAAVSCPPLASAPYSAKNLEKTLEEKARGTIRDPTFCRIDAAGRKIALSKIFEWYRDDFERGGESLRDYLARYSESSLPEDPAFEFLEYDWTLNDLARAKDELPPPEPSPASPSGGQRRGDP